MVIVCLGRPAPGCSRSGVPGCASTASRAGHWVRRRRTRDCRRCCGNRCKRFACPSARPWWCCRCKSAWWSAGWAGASGAAFGTRDRMVEFESLEGNQMLRGSDTARAGRYPYMDWSLAGAGAMTAQTILVLIDCWRENRRAVAAADTLYQILRNTNDRGHVESVDLLEA